MPPKVLTTGPVLADEEVDEAGATLPPVPDNVVVLLKNLQQQISDLTDRVEALEP
jgi:hypothetical protein